MPNFIYPPQRIAREEGSSGWVARKS
jgi:hypothetical protein